jgi:hypothetical protein
LARRQYLHPGVVNIATFDVSKRADTSSAMPRSVNGQSQQG